MAVLFENTSAVQVVGRHVTSKVFCEEDKRSAIISSAARILKELAEKKHVLDLYIHVGRGSSELRFTHGNTGMWRPTMILLF